MTNYVRCPNPDCGTSWGIEEISFQECDCCGWPNVEEEESDDIEYDDSEYDEYE